MLHLFALSFFPGLMIYVAISDLATMTIPNRISLALIGGFFVMALWTGMSGEEIASHVKIGAITLLVCFLLFQFNAMGGGDGKVAAASALWLGSPLVYDYIVYASFVGLLLALPFLYLRFFEPPAFTANIGWLDRFLKRAKGKLPYGVALAIGAVLVYPQSTLMQMAVA